MKKLLKIACILVWATHLAWAGSPVVSPNGANYSIEFEDGLQIESSTFSLKIDGKWIYGNTFPRQSWKMEAGKHILTCTGLAPLESFQLVFEMVAEEPYVVVKARLLAASEFQLGGVRLVTTREEQSNINVGKNHAQWNAFVEHLHGPKTGRIMWLDQMEQLNGNAKGEDLRDGFWITTLQNDLTNQTFASAALGGELWPTIFEWRNVSGSTLQFSIRSGSPEGLEEILVRPGAAVEPDPVLIGYWSDQRPTRALAEVGRIMGESVRKGRPMRMIDPGWSTWHSYARTVSADGMIRAARAMKNDLFDAGFRYIQLDGGWWTVPGSYVVGDDFPKGIRDVRNQVTEMGLKFGLHISPLRVNPTDPYWKTHADWLLSPYGKDPIDPHDDEMMTTLGMVYLDGSHPDVPPYLAGQFKQLVEDYKPTFMKWDHHYGGLEEGDRFDPTMTGLQAHNKAIRMIRAALPDDLVVTRSMGWLYGAIECYDAIRIGNDINHPGVHSDKEPYANITFGETSGTIRNVLEGREYKGLIRFARSVAQNYYIHKNIAICDPDAFFATPQYTLEEARMHITLQALMGGFLFSGDRIDFLPEDRLALYKHAAILDVWSNHKHAVPLDLFSGVDIPRIWKLELTDRIVFGFFNWMDEPAETIWSLQDLELPAGSYRLTDLWSEEAVSMDAHALQLSMPAHTVRLIEFKQ